MRSLGVIGVVSPGAYWSAVVVALCICAASCALARRRPGRWTRRVARAVGAALLADIVVYSVGLAVAGSWSASSSLPLALCNVVVIVAAVACWWPVAVLVELTYFLGLTGALQAVVTPDLTTGFPHLVFFEFVVGHLGIVFAALFLVAGIGIVPRRGAAVRVFVIAASYTAVVGIVDGATGANYMFLRRPPSEWTLLRLLGPWPWYVVSAAGVAAVAFALLDLPFAAARRARPTDAVRASGSTKTRS